MAGAACWRVGKKNLQRKKNTYAGKRQVAVGVCLVGVWQWEETYIWDPFVL